MDDNLAAQVRQRMRERDTDSLLAIWRREDGEGWSDEAYEIVRQTLAERGVAPPAPVPASGSERAAADDDEEDVYHNFGRLMSVASWATTLSWLFLGVAGALLLLLAFTLLSVLFGARGLGLGTDLTLIVIQAGGCLFFAFFFVLCQTLSQTIYLLLDIEANTRPAELKQA